MWSGRDRRRLLPSTLPLLATSNRVLLPGASVVLHVTDPRGLVVAIWVVCVMICNTHMRARTQDQLGGEQAVERRRLEGQIHWNCASTATATLRQGEVDCHVVTVYAFIILLLFFSSVALCWYSC